MTKLARAKKPAPPKIEVRQIPVETISVDQRAQSRAALNLDTVSEYAEAMAEGAQFPPLVVFLDGDGTPWLAEGFHRHRAAQEAALEAIACEIREGGLREAILHSVGSNATHGLRRTNEDKRRAVKILLQDEEWSAWSNVEIGRRCCVSDEFVRKVRASLPTVGSEPEPRTYRDRYGNVTQMRTAAIGRRPDQEPEQDTPSAPPTAPEAPAASNVISLGTRLDPLPSPEAIETKLLAEEVAEEFEGAEDYDPTRLEDRALAINGALWRFDHVKMTGRDYWRVYGKSPEKETFVAWVRAAKATIDDILKEYPNA
jgi:hypothetical protein